MTTAILTALAIAGARAGLGTAMVSPQVRPTVPYPIKPETSRKPGILDRIQTCESREAAHLMWHEFLDHANSVSQKTVNKANRLLSTLDFPLP